MAKVKRSLFRSFLNTGTLGSPTWSLIGDGVTTAMINYNPQTVEETYIVDDSASISVDSYAPNFPVEMTAISGDAVFDFIDALGYYFAIAFSWVVFAAVFLIVQGYFSWAVVIPIVLGSLVGGYIGSKYAKYKGNQFIKIVFVIFGTVLGLKLLAGF